MKERRNYLHFSLMNTIVPDKNAATLRSEMGRGNYNKNVIVSTGTCQEHRA